MPRARKQASKERTKDQEVEGHEEPLAPAFGKARLVVPALAALVLRQARRALIEGRMIAGVDQKYDSPIGLSVEDRRAMALVSRACLANERPDHGAEIHELLAMCAKPLGEWLPLEEVNAQGLATTTLISADSGAPTAEAAELASGFSTITAGVEELLFANFRDALAKQPKAAANKYYTAVREFVVRNPLSTAEQIKAFGSELPSTLWLQLQQNFYEPVPFTWGVSGEVPTCANCGNALRKAKAGTLVCRTTACAAGRITTPGSSRSVEGLLRVTRGIQQYWVEPGVDEMWLYDALRARGANAELYPFMDRVDIAVGDVGIDLKSYASPELLGDKIRRDKGGLAHYDRKWLVIPDWLVSSTPRYLERLRHALEDTAKTVRCLTVEAALKELTHA